MKIHVIDHPRGGSAVRRGGSLRALKVHRGPRARGDALRHARSIARADEADVYVHRRNGTVDYVERFEA